MGAEITGLYDCNCHKCKTLKTNLGANISKPKPILKEIENLGDGEISTALFKHVNKHLSDSIDDVFTAKYGEGNYELVNELKKNSSLFSAFKSAYYTKLIQQQDKEKYDAIIATYERQLSTEGNLVSRSARSAKQWQEYERTKDIYPNLEYLASRSTDKREEHKELYGIIKPIHDDFWRTHYPPNGWGCKCRTAKSDEQPTQKDVSIELTKGIAGNVALDKVIFTNSHPIIKGTSAVGKQRIKKQFEQLKTKIDYNKYADYEAENNSSIYVHSFADSNDLPQNFEAAKLLTTTVANIEVKIRPHVNSYTGIGKNGTSNPEFLINGLYGDLKEVTGSSITPRFKSAKKQGCKIVIFKINSSMTVQRAIEQIDGELSFRKQSPFQRIFILKDDKIIEHKKRVDTALNS